MPYETFDDVVFHTQVFGQGPPVVCVHGLVFGNLASWMFGTAGALSDRYTVYLFDLRGHGRSSRPATGYCLDSMTHDLANLIDRWELLSQEPLTLIGHSFGALMCLKTALSRPVERLVLVEPPMPPTPVMALHDLIQLQPHELLEALPESLRQEIAKGSRRAHRFIHRLRELAENTTFRTDIESPNVWNDDALASLSTSTLIVMGDESPCLDGGLVLAKRLPYARVVQLSGGHFLTTEAPAALQTVVEGFLG